MSTAPYILIVEDEEPLTMLLRYNLEAEGYRVEVVETGEAGLRKRRHLGHGLRPLLLQAQNNLTTTATERYFNVVRRNLEASADAMPADKYGFRLTEGQMTFAQWLIHATQRNYSDCAALKSEPVLDAERKALTLCERDHAGVWQVVRNLPLPVSDFSSLQPISLGGTNQNAVAFLGLNSAAWLPLTGDVWELT